MEFLKGPLRGLPAEQLVSVALAAEIHPFPFRTRKLSPPAPMVLGWIRPGRVGRRRFLTHASLTSVRLAVFLPLGFSRSRDVPGARVRTALRPPGPLASRRLPHVRE